MCGFMGNHDVPRFLSHAAGDIGDMWGNGSKEQGFYDPPGQPAGETPYLKARLAFGLLLTLPGIPLIYYGDEIGLAGAGDPDNRRVMPWNGLTPHQEALRAAVSVLGGLRRDLPALRRGTLDVVMAQPDLIVFRRGHPDGDVMVAASLSPLETVVEVPVDVPGAVAEERISGGALTVTGGVAEVTLLPYGVAVITAAP
jgi:glycosidase